MGSRARDGLWRSPSEAWLDHVTVTEEDISDLSRATTIRAWAARVPKDFWSMLAHLERLELVGGSVRTFEPPTDCRRLRWLQINQVTGLSDLSFLTSLRSLELVDLYGLPQVRDVPSLAVLTRLRFALIGSMKRLEGLDGLLDAPSLRELTLSTVVPVRPADVERIRSHPTLRAFGWFTDGAVADRTWRSVVDAVGISTRPTVTQLTWPLPPER